MRDLQESASNKPPQGSRSWLLRPLGTKNLLLIGYASCLFILTFLRLPRSSLEPVFLAGMCLGIGSVSALVFSPGSRQAGSKSAAFFFAFLMHGFLAATSIINSGYYPRMLIGGNFGEAIPYSACVVLLEWGAVILLGRPFASHGHPTVPLWVVTCMLLTLAVVVAAPKLQEPGYRVVSGQPPVRYSRFSEPMGSAEPATALIDGIFVQVQTGYDREAQKNFSVLRGCDVKNDKAWTLDVFPSTYVLPWAFLALREHGELLVVHETGQTDEAGDKAVWITAVDIQSVTKGKPEYVERAPWLGPDPSAVLLEPRWQRPPFSYPLGISIEVDHAGQSCIRGPDFEWEVTGDQESISFMMGQDTVVMREARNETYQYQIFLLPSSP